MTAKEYRDHYAKEQGFDDWADMVKHTHWDIIDKHTNEVMKGYALSVLPDRIEETNAASSEEYYHRIGSNNCIEQIKKNIG